MNEAWNIEYITLFYSRTCLVIILFTKYPLLANVNQNVSNKKGIGFNKFLIVQHNFRNKKKSKYKKFLNYVDSYKIPNS